MRRADPVMVGLRRVRPQVHGEFGLDPQDVAPFHRPIVREFIAREKRVDQRRPFVGTAVGQERIHFAWLGQACRSYPGRRG